MNDKEGNKLELPEDLTEESEEIPPESIVKKIVLGAVAALAIAGMIYLSGVYPLFFYWRTPPAAEEKEIAPKVDGETIVIPLHIYILKDEGEFGSERSEEDAMRLVSNAANIWSQARLELRAVKISILPMASKELAVFYDEPGKFIAALPNFNPSIITVVLVKYLNGINGIAFGGWQATAVADYTTVYDFRTLAHEIGHLLGLDHTAANTSRLMYRGANGTTLTREEIERARKTAEILYGGKL